MILVASLFARINAMTCNTFDPESIDSVDYNHSIQTYQLLQERIFEITRIGVARRNTCIDAMQKFAYDSCISSLKELSQLRKHLMDSADRINKKRYLYIVRSENDTDCMDLDSTKPISITYSKSSMAMVFGVIHIGMDSMVTKIIEIDSATQDSGRSSIRVYHMFRKKATHADFNLIQSAIRASRIMEFKRYYATNIYDGVQIEFTIEQPGKRKTVRLSNYHPKEVSDLISSLGVIASDADRVFENAKIALGHYNVLVNGWDSSKPFSIPKVRRDKKHQTKKIQKPIRTDPCDEPK